MTGGDGEGLPGPGGGNGPEPFDRLARLLSRDGLAEEAARLDDLLHRRAWTTGSELLGELGLELRRIRSERWGAMGAESREGWKACARRVGLGRPSFFPLLPY